MARNGCQEFRSYFCIISTNQPVFCDTVEKSRDVKLKHFYTSLLCLPIIFMLSSKLWLQRFPAFKSLLCPQRGQVEKMSGNARNMGIIQSRMENGNQNSLTLYSSKNTSMQGQEFYSMGHSGFFWWWGKSLQLGYFLGRENDPCKKPHFQMRT